jgi:tetratricopeptide (TPR) repeat protein
LKHLDKAFELAQKARELAPADPHVAALLGRIAYGKGNFPLAYGLLQEATIPIRVTRAQNEIYDATAGVTLHDFAWAAYAEGKVEEAEQAMQRVLQTAPASVQAEDARSFLAMTDLEEHPSDRPETAGQIAKILSGTPDYVPALMAQAGLQMRNGETKAAVGAYTSVLRRFPDFFPAQKRLAAFYLKDPATLDMAHDLAAKAHKTLPHDPELCQILGEISYRRKEYPYAIQLLQESAGKRPLDAQSLYCLGMSLRETGEKVKSRDVLQQALKAGLSAPLSAEVTQILAKSEKK